jgi:hypothetical protein
MSANRDHQPGHLAVFRFAGGARTARTKTNVRMISITRDFRTLASNRPLAPSPYLSNHGQQEAAPAIAPRN